MCKACKSIAVADLRGGPYHTLSGLLHLSLEQLLASAERGCELCNAIKDEARLANAPSPPLDSQNTSFLRGVEALPSHIDPNERQKEHISYYVSGYDCRLSIADRKFSWRVEFGMFTRDGTFQ